MNNETVVRLKGLGFKIQSAGYDCPAGTYVAVQKENVFGFLIIFIDKDGTIFPKFDGMIWASSAEARNAAKCYASTPETMLDFDLAPGTEVSKDVPLNGYFEPLDFETGESD